jgi:phage tail sheath protein FI
MPEYLHPGVYVEEIPGGSKPIEWVGTSTVAFVGYTAQGPVGEPTLVTRWESYEEIFGGIRDTDRSTTGDQMGFAVKSFFLNGGNAAYVVRAIRDINVSATEGIPGNSVNCNYPDLTSYRGIFAGLENYRDVNILCVPGQTWDTPGEKAIIEAAVAHAEKMKNRMVIIDPPVGKELKTGTDVTDLGLRPKSHSVVYYPWLRVANPYYKSGKNPGAPKTVLVGPCGFSAGIWARIDSLRGVWKAPAGVETSLHGVESFQYAVDDRTQVQLNSQGINCLRKMRGLGPVVWGARTLATQAAPEWRYIPVKRTAIFIEQSIYNGIQWAVFESNDHHLWASLRMNIESFMNDLFRYGAFQGQKASDAYFVRCGLGDTMTQGDIDRGQVIVIVGFAPIKPAEFVIIRISQKVRGK